MLILIFLHKEVNHQCTFSPPALTVRRRVYKELCVAFLATTRTTTTTTTTTTTRVQRSFVRGGGGGTSVHTVLIDDLIIQVRPLQTCVGIFTAPCIGMMQLFPQNSRVVTQVKVQNHSCFVIGTQAFILSGGIVGHVKCQLTTKGPFCTSYFFKLQSDVWS
jgi:hypothetical protein